MIHDAAVPPSLPQPSVRTADLEGILHTSAVWTTEELAALATHLERVGGQALRRLPTSALAAAWHDAIAALRDPDSPQRAALEQPLTRLSRLSPQGLGAALEAVLGGVGKRPADALFRQAEGRPAAGLVVVLLASNLPALAVQPLLPALALRRPVLLKSPSAEPLFAPALVRALVRREPALADAVAAIAWPGGTTTLEDPVLEAAATVVAYGEEATLRELRRRCGAKLLEYGPRISLAVVSEGPDPRGVAHRLARDIALFDQRGCLSVQAVYTDREPRPLADELARALSRRAVEWPQGPLDPVSAAGVQQLRAEADMRGLYRPGMPIGEGTVVVDPLPELHPSPGLRTVRLYPLEDLKMLPGLLAGWRGRLQGAALAGEGAWRLRQALEELGVSRCTEPGELQHPDALWHNGGRHPLEALAATATAATSSGTGPSR